MPCARDEGRRGILVSSENAEEAAVVDGLNVYSNQRLLRMYAKLLAAETEFWRHGRNCAAVMEFCGLGYSRGDGQTSDHWADLEKLTWDPDFYTYVRDSFAPVEIMIDAYDPAT